MKVSNSGDWLLVATDLTDSPVELWDLQQKKKTQTIKNGNQKRAAEDFDFSSNGAWACIVYSDGSMSTINLETGHVTEFSTIDLGFRTNCKFSNDSKSLVTFAKNEVDENNPDSKTQSATIEVWSFDSCQMLFEAAKSLTSH